METLNVCNTVSHYREELGKIREDGYTPGLLSRREEEKLSRMGVIEQDDRGHVVVPWEVEILLSRLKKGV